MNFNNNKLLIIAMVTVGQYVVSILTVMCFTAWTVTAIEDCGSPTPNPSIPTTDCENIILIINRS